MNGSSILPLDDRGLKLIRKVLNSLALLVLVLWGGAVYAMDMPKTLPCSSHMAMVHENEAADPMRASAAVVRLVSEHPDESMPDCCSGTGICRMGSCAPAAGLVPLAAVKITSGGIVFRPLDGQPLVGRNEPPTLGPPRASSFAI